MKYLSIWRRILSILYDSFLIFALLVIMSMPFYSFNIEEDFALKIMMQIYFYFIIQFFFVWFWVNNRATLGMRSWGVIIVDDTGNGISYKRAIIRFNMAIISFAIFGLGFFISIVRKDKKCMHDIISKTYLIKL
jgi:uncharacterized RDD family membrane protein YckC